MTSVPPGEAEALPSQKQDFDIEIVVDNFKRCFLDPDKPDQVMLQNYLDAFSELCRFFKLMGRTFSFVTYDIESKIAILQAHLDGAADAKQYRTVQSMIAYEKSLGFNLGRRVTNGSRTLLRLHRACEFILNFMKVLVHSADEDPVSKIAASVYEETLAKYHPWLVRKMATWAMVILPSKEKLVHLMCKHDTVEVMRLTDECIEHGMKVYENIQSVYSENDLLDLP